MNLPIQNPPVGWRVIPSADAQSLEIRRGYPDTDVKSPVLPFGGGGLFLAAIVGGVRIWNGAAPLDALLSGPTLFVLSPAATMIGVALFAARNPGDDRWFVLASKTLTIHSRFDSKTTSTTLERSRILRFIRTREDDPADPNGTTWWLDFEARGSGVDPDEIYIGLFTDRQEADWFTALFERWSGLRVRDEVMAPNDDADSEDDDGDHRP
jgi:hypothetical protein